MRSSEPHRRNRAPLVRLAGRAFVFSLPLLLLWAALEAIMARVPNLHSEKRAQFERARPSIETLITGSSDAFYGLDPATLGGSAYNFANLSQSLYYADLLVTRELPRLPRLRRAIVTVGYASLYLQFRRDELDGPTQYFWNREWQIPPQRTEDRFDLRMWSRVALCDWHVLAAGVGRWWTSQRTHAPLAGVPGLTEDGWWTGAQGSTNLDSAAAGRVLASHHAEMRDENVDANTASLEHLLDALDARGIDTVILVMPVWKTYAAGMDPRRWAEATARYERLAVKHHARFLDFHDTPQLTKDDFHDPDHLNPVGAVRFTRLVQATIDAPTRGKATP